jgi:hypothetical protein
LRLLASGFQAHVNTGYSSRLLKKVEFVPNSRVMFHVEHSWQ